MKISAVLNAFMILGVVTSIYAVLGCIVFADRDLVNFGSFSRSLFTMFQVGLKTLLACRHLHILQLDA